MQIQITIFSPGNENPVEVVPNFDLEQMDPRSDIRIGFQAGVLKKAALELTDGGAIMYELVPDNIN